MASTASRKPLPPEAIGVLAGVLEGPYGGLFTGGLFWRRPDWRVAFFSGLGWLTAGMPGSPPLLALWIGQGVLELWRRGRWSRVLAVLGFAAGGLLFRFLWLAPLGVVLAEVARKRRHQGLALGGLALAGLGVYGPTGLLLPLGAWWVARLPWREGSRFRGMDLPSFLYGAAMLLRNMAATALGWR